MAKKKTAKHKRRHTYGAFGRATPAGKKRISSKKKAFSKAYKAFMKALG